MGWRGQEDVGVAGRMGAVEEGLLLSLLGPRRCVQQLLKHGAHINSRTEEEEDTALHVAARHGLTDHVQLLLQHGAELEARNEEGQTPLNAACAQPHSPQDTERYYRVCQLLVESGASVNAADRDHQHPLHLACKNANAQIVELLLAQGANVNIMNYSGNTALHNILQAAAYKLEHHPELVVRTLLNYGAIRIWPGSLLKVCAAGCAAGRAGSDIGIPVRVRVVLTQQGVLWACWPGCFLPGPGGEGKAAIAEGFPEAFSLGHVLL